MGKVKWGIKGSEIDEADIDEGFAPYEGPDVTAGVYPVVIKSMVAADFQSGNPGIKTLFIVDAPKGHPKEAFNGAPLWDNLAMVATQDRKARQYGAALGITGKDFDNTVEDAERNITSIGRKKGLVGTHLRVQVKMEPYGDAMSPKVNGYLPPTPESLGNAAPAGKKASGLAAVSNEEAPAEEKPAKAKKDKAGKKAKGGSTEDPPF